MVNYPFSKNCDKVVRDRRRMAGISRERAKRMIVVTDRDANVEHVQSKEGSSRKNQCVDMDISGNQFQIQDTQTSKNLIIQILTSFEK